VTTFCVGEMFRRIPCDKTHAVIRRVRTYFLDGPIPVELLHISEDSCLKKQFKKLGFNLSIPKADRRILREDIAHLKTIWAAQRKEQLKKEMALYILNREKELAEQQIQKFGSVQRTNMYFNAGLDNITASGELVGDWF